MVTLWLLRWALGRNQRWPMFNEKGIFTYSGEAGPGREPDLQLVVGDSEKNNLTEKDDFNHSITLPVLSLADRIAAESRYYGLIIGIDQYADETHPGPGQSRQGCRKGLRGPGEHTMRFEEENILLSQGSLPAAT